jgi:hypothetical protein
MKLLKFKPTNERLPLLIGATSKRIINMQGEYTVYGMLPDGDWAPIAGKHPIEIDTLASMRDLLFMIDNYIRVYDGITYKGMTIEMANIYQTYMDDRRDISVN